MANRITRHIPNATTCCNLFSGCIACVMAYEMKYELAVAFIILGAIFDFFDGMLARLLNVSGLLGKELDSLADDITFGLAPAMIVFSLFKEVHYPEFLIPLSEYIPYTAFIIALFSILRLGKFNIDPRQTSSFIGMPTPAIALFWGSLVMGLQINRNMYLTLLSFQDKFLNFNENIGISAISNHDVRQTNRNK